VCVCVIAGCVCVRVCVCVMEGCVCVMEVCVNVCVIAGCVCVCAHVCACVMEVYMWVVEGASTASGQRCPQQPTGRPAQLPEDQGTGIYT